MFGNVQTMENLCPTQIFISNDRSSHLVSILHQEEGLAMKCQTGMDLYFFCLLEGRRTDLMAEFIQLKKKCS